MIFFNLFTVHILWLNSRMNELLQGDYYSSGSSSNYVTCQYMVKYPHVSVFRTLNRVLQKQVVTPIMYSSIQFFRKSTVFFFTAKDAWSFYKLCDFKRSIAQWLFPLCFIQIDNILKRHFLTPRVLFCNVPNRFTQAMHKKPISLWKENWHIMFICFS